MGQILPASNARGESVWLNVVINTELLLVEVEPKARFLCQALREGKRCVTAHWLNTVLKKKRMVPPHRTLHLPFAFPPGAKPCSQHVCLPFLLTVAFLQSLYLVNLMNFKILHSNWQEVFLLVRALLQLSVCCRLSSDHISDWFYGCWQRWSKTDGLPGWCQIHRISLSQ